MIGIGYLQETVPLFLWKRGQKWEQKCFAITSMNAATPGN
jgi:hypothetical protein